MENKYTNFEGSPATHWDAVNDEKLLSSMAEGNADERQHAFDVFYRRHASYLYGICFNVANRYKFGFFGEDDLFQETMLKARDHAKTFVKGNGPNAGSVEDQVDAWLGKIAKRVALDLIRRIPKCIVLDPGFVNVAKTDDESFLQVIEPIIFEEGSVGLQLLRDAIETLSAKEKEVIWAVSQFYVRRDHQHTPSDDLNEIIGSLGISRDNFRKIKQRAKAKILQFMTNRNLKAEAK